MTVRVRRIRSRAGYSLIEVLGNVAMLGILAAATLPHIDLRRTDLQTMTKQVIADYRFARVRAITTGVHYDVKWSGGSTYQIRRLKLNGANWILDTAATNGGIVKQATLPPTVQWSGTDTIEFNTRGLMVTSATTLSQTLTDVKFGGTRVINVWPSGQINENS